MTSTSTFETSGTEDSTRNLGKTEGGCTDLNLPYMPLSSCKFTGPIMKPGSTIVTWVAWGRSLNLTNAILQETVQDWGEEIIL